MIPLDPLTAMRLQRWAEHLDSPGTGSIAEFLAEIGAEGGALSLILDQFKEHRQRSAPDKIRVAGADRLRDCVPAVPE
jgi:hypothetical protein